MKERLTERKREGDQAKEHGKECKKEYENMCKEKGGDGGVLEKGSFVDKKRKLWKQTKERKRQGKGRKINRTGDERKGKKGTISRGVKGKKRNKE